MLDPPPARGRGVILTGIVSARSAPSSICILSEGAQRPSRRIWEGGCHTETRPPPRSFDSLRSLRMTGGQGTLLLKGCWHE